VKRHIEASGWVAYRKPRHRLARLESWLAERFRQHRGNCEVAPGTWRVSMGIAVSLRTIECAMATLRQALRAEAQACVRYGS
jgi:hypothetical protein